MKNLLIICFAFIISSCSSQENKIEETKQTQTQGKMKVEIWSDVACPFCYIGKRNFDDALNEFESRDDIEVVWKSFQLDPTPQSELPTDLTMYQYLAQRKGISVKESEKMHENVTKMAKKAGLTYRFDIAKMSNTFDAARLIHFAQEKGVQSEAKEALFSAHFTEGLDVADTTILLQIGENIGLDKKAVKSMLESDDYVSDVNKDIQEAQEVGVTGVPFFVIDRKYAVSGAQESKSFTEIIEKAYAERRQ